MTAPVAAVRPVYRSRFTFRHGKSRRTIRNRWFSFMPVWVWGIRGENTIGATLRVGEIIHYAYVARRREPVRYEATDG